MAQASTLATDALSQERRAGAQQSLGRASRCCTAPPPTQSLLQARREGTRQPQQGVDTPEHGARCAVLSLLGTYLRLCEDVPHRAISSWTTVAMLCSLLWELEFRETARRMVREEPAQSGSLSVRLHALRGLPAVNAAWIPGLPDWMLHLRICLLRLMTSPCQACAASLIVFV